MNTQVINVGHKENGNKLVQQWLVATNINPAQRAVRFAMEIKSFETIAESPAVWNGFFLIVIGIQFF